MNKSLSVMKVQANLAPGRYSDGNGLYLQVARGGTKTWLFRYSKSGKAREMGLGSIKLVALAQARVKALECKRLLLENLDPIDERKKRQRQAQIDSAKNITFDQCADDYISAFSKSWRNQKHIGQWTSTIRSYVSPTIGNLPVHEITTDHVRRILEPIWREKTETASRVRGRIESVLAWATVRSLRSGQNPAVWRNHLDKIFPKESTIKKVKHFKALPINEIGNFVAKLRSLCGVSPLALEFCILTATRTNEVIGARWAEINYEDKAWIIPAERMKANREHRIPLCDRALEILKLAQVISHSESPFIFGGLKANKHLSNVTLLKVIKSLNYSVTTHGFRSTFRDWAAERTNFSSEVVEAALAHTIRNKTEAAYFRSDLFLKRRKLMDAWAKYCEATPCRSGAIIDMADKKFA